MLVLVMYDLLARCNPFTLHYIVLQHDAEHGVIQPNRHLRIVHCACAPVDVVQIPVDRQRGSSTRHAYEARPLCVSTSW